METKRGKDERERERERARIGGDRVAKEREGKRWENHDRSKGGGTGRKEWKE
jgi:hypothetical protein